MHERKREWETTAWGFYIFDAAHALIFVYCFFIAWLCVGIFSKLRRNLLSEQFEEDEFEPANNPTGAFCVDVHFMHVDDDESNQISWLVFFLLDSGAGISDDDDDASEGFG